jgi:hypothetical protein
MNSDSRLNSAISFRLLVIPSEMLPEHAGTVSFLGSQSRQGDWDPDDPGWVERLTARFK